MIHNKELRERVEKMDYSSCASTSLQAMRDFVSNQIEQWDKAEQMAGHAMRDDLDKLKIDMLCFLSATEKSIEKKLGKIVKIEHQAGYALDDRRIIITYEGGDAEIRKYDSTTKSVEAYFGLLGEIIGDRDERNNR
jgi:hypothetical protein